MFTALLAPRRFDSPAEESFYRAARRVGLYLRPQREIGPYRVDFTHSRGLLRMKRFVVEIDGHDYHHASREQVRRDYERERYLEARGWQVVRFTGSEVYRAADKCVARLEEIAAAAPYKVFGIW